MKTTTLLIAISVVLFTEQGLFAESSTWKDKTDFTNEIKKEIHIAEADTEEDEDLFMDDGEESEGEDWAEEGESSAATTPEPAKEEPAQEEIAAEAPKPKPVAKPAKPAPKKGQAKLPVKKVKKYTKARVPASFKQGLKVSNANCSMHASPSDRSPVLLKTDAGKKLWLESANGNWYKGYHKNGHGFFPAHCFK